MDAALARARELVQRATRVCALTGAGVSAESGIPTFRGFQGLWEDHRPEELATPEAFARDPEQVWRFYRWRRAALQEASPNAGHLALARFEARRSLDLVTQNVDGLHQAAGSKGPIELHGCLMRSRCHECATRCPLAEEGDGPVPTCSRCGGPLRPDVVWFGEVLPAAALQRAMTAAGDCDLFLSLGTSAVVQPAASLPLLAARRGVPVIEVNPETTPLSEMVTLHLPAATGEVLPQLLD